MRRTVVVDGYNVVHASKELAEAARSFGVERARADLIAALGRYAQGQGCECIVVFDGVVEPAPSAPLVRVLFSGTRQADDVIRDQVRRAGERFLVISSDRAVSDAARMNRALTRSSADFAAELVPLLAASTQPRSNPALRPHRLDELRESSEKPDVSDEDIDEWKRFFGEE